MADFSVSSTQLSAPQGAGANVIGAVQQAPPDTSGFMSSPLVASVVDVFAKGLVQTRKEEADKFKNTIVNGYIREETTLNDAVASGQMSPAEAAARSRANFNRNAATHGQFIDEFEKAGKALRGFTEKGESEKAVELEAKRREASINLAIQRGFVFPEGMSKESQDSQILAATTSVRAEAALSEMYKSNAEKRAQGTFDAGVAAKEEKDMGFKLVNEIAGTNLTAFQDFAKTTSDAVRAGKMAPEMAQAVLTERFTNISGALQAAARTNPELAAPYRSLFDSVYKIGQQMSDPKSNLEALEAQLKEQQTKMKLVAMAKPETAALIVANQLMPNNLALQTRVGAIELLAVLSSKPVGDKSFTPQFIGDVAVEKETLDLLKKGLNDLKSGKISNKEIATIQASNSVNQILKQTSELINRGVPPETLTGVASFFASADYAGFVAQGAIDKDAAGAAKKAFQILYEPAVVQKVQERLNKTLDREPVSRSLNRPWLGSNRSEAVERIKVLDVVDIKFSGSGVIFEAKDSKTLSPVEVISQRQILEGLKSSQAGLTQLIHIGAHMEGSTDYGKFWEANKHVYMPNTFPDPVRLSVGQVVKAKNGKSYKYLGGDFNDIEKSYQEVMSGQSK